MNQWRKQLAELESAEEFLEYFEIPFDPAVVRVNRLHILQRFHDYLGDGFEVRDAAFHRAALRRAYGDFVGSDALTEKVFRVFQRQPQVAFVALSDLRRKP